MSQLNGYGSSLVHRAQQWIVATSLCWAALRLASTYVGSAFLNGVGVTGGQ